jgi:hypothetical protein
LNFISFSRRDDLVSERALTKKLALRATIPRFAGPSRKFSPEKILFCGDATSGK